MTEIVLVNDILSGSMGEKVFWNYMLEKIPNIYGVETSKVKNPGLYINENFSKDAIVIQNATFIPKISNKKTISFLQDNLRKMNKNSKLQEDTLRQSDYIIFNSKEISRHYSDYTGTIIPIGIDTDLFKIKDKVLLRNKYGLNNTKTGIFVGNFNHIKGWEEVKHIINKYQDINFILVSKNEEKYSKHNTFCYSRVNQNILAELLNCADFFILGSPVETQCLAALEAGFCGLPIIMKPTGIFMDWADRDLLGIFENNLEQGLLKLLNRSYNTREYLISKNLSIDSMINSWVTFLSELK